MVYSGVTINQLSMEVIMAARKIARFVGSECITEVYRDSEWNEYQVRVVGLPHPATTYFTDDKQDAILTAKGTAGKLI